MLTAKFRFLLLWNAEIEYKEKSHIYLCLSSTIGYFKLEKRFDFLRDISYKAIILSKRNWIFHSKEYFHQLWIIVKKIASSKDL